MSHWFYVTVYFTIGLEVHMDVEKYLMRLAWPGSCPCSPTLETLRRLHLQHLLSVPFEDLTIHTGARVQLELALLYDKIVVKRRGGFCYEINGLFSWLLDQLGFEVEILAAQVRNRFTGVYGPPFDHLVMMVTLEGQRWLCDVGFGNGFQFPLSLEVETPQTQSHGVYRVRAAAGNLLFVETRAEAEDWLALYKLTLQPRQREDFKAMCLYHQTSVSSVFFCKSLCTLLLPSGRVTLMGRKLITSLLSGEDGAPAKTMKEGLTDEEIIEILKETFGIVLTAPLISKDIDIVVPSVIY